MTSADLDFATGNTINIGLKTLNSANAATLTFVPTVDFFGALDVRPEDGALFGGTGNQHELFRINAATGAETLIGDTGRTFVGDLAFQPVPEPVTLGLADSGLLAFALYRRVRRPQ